MQDKISFEAIRNGDLKEFEVLFKKYFASMCIVAHRYIANTQAAEDIVQDIFIRLWEKKEEYKDIPDLQVFLYVLVKNRCIDYLRSQKDTVEYTQSELVKQADVFEDIVQEEEICRLIDEAIASLPPQSARIMNFVLAGKQNKEIAENLNISVNSVKTLKYNALNTLRKMLEEKYYSLLMLITYHYSE